MRSLLAGAAAAVALLQTPGCTADDEYVVTEEPPSGGVEVSVEFAPDQDQSAVAAVHMWVLSAEEGANSRVLCAQLVGGDLEPHDLSLVQRAEVVSNDPNALLEHDEIEPGPVLIYVEAVDFRGDVQLAGCSAVAIADDSTRSVEVPLRTARVYLCNHEAAEDGAPCDDGLFCTVGETCESGECQEGSSRSCSHLRIGCVRGVCTEENGCVTEPIADGDSCDDDLFCTVGEVCSAGRCVGGTQRDCSAEAGQCEVALGCDELQGGCILDSAPVGTPCDDGLWCTVDDNCDSGYCDGNPRDCSVGRDQCDSGVCDEDADQCVPDPVPPGAPCDDGLACTENDACDASGACVGTAVLCTGQCYTGECAEPAGCVPADPATSCDDGSACTENDACDGSGSCAGTAVLCDGPCEIGPCTEPSGCGLQPAGTLCGTPDPCLATCDALGACGTVQALDGTPCDDGDPLTDNDQCTGGVCAGTSVGG